MRRLLGSSALVAVTALILCLPPSLLAQAGGNGTPMPEGGSPFSYLGLAGLLCVGAIVYSRRDMRG